MQEWPQNSEFLLSGHVINHFSCPRVYNFLSTGKGAPDVAALLDLMRGNGHGESSSILNQTSRSLRSTLLQNGMAERLVDELATVAVRVNYGQGSESQNSS